MSDELLTLKDIAELYRCSYRHARDVITKLVGLPELAPGSTSRHPLWLRIEVQAYAEFIGEDSPGKEQEAYAVQCVFQSLAGEYARRIEAKTL